MFNNINLKIKKWLVVAMVVLISIWAVFWVFTRGFVVVDSQTDLSELEVALVNSAGEETSFTAEPGDRKLIRSGSYEIKVETNDGNYFGTIEVPSLLRSTTSDIKLTSQRTRGFVGSNPKSCMAYNEVLISYQCGGSAGSLQIHTKANSATPSIINQPDLFAFSGFEIKNHLRIDGSLYALLSFIGDDGRVLSLHSVTGDGSLKVEAARILTEYTSQEVEYSAISHKDGFILSAADGGQILLFDSLDDTNPTKLLPDSPNNQAQNLYSITSSDDRVAITQTSGIGGALSSSSYFPSFFPEAETEGELARDENNEPTKTVVSIINGDQARQFSFDFAVSQVEVCGEELLCVLKTGGDFFVYDVSGDTTAKRHGVDNVLQLSTVGGQLLLIQPDGVIAFNPKAGSGYFQYTFSGYDYCGIQPISSSAYLLCVDDGQGSRSRSVLRINTKNKLDGSAIDKQVFELAKLPEINTIAPYGRFIHISPELGELQSNPGGGLEYDPQTISRVNQAINTKAEQLGIDFDTYKLIKPYSDR